MKKFLLLSALWSAFATLQAQVTFQDAYEQFKQQAKGEYEHFREEANKAYVEFIGQSLAHIIHPYNGQILSDIKATTEGTVFFTHNRPVVLQNALLFMIHTA